MTCNLRHPTSVVHPVSCLCLYYQLTHLLPMSVRSTISVSLNVVRWVFTHGYYTGPPSYPTKRAHVSACLCACVDNCKPVDQQSIDIRQCRLSRFLRLFCGFVGLFSHFNMSFTSFEASRHWWLNHTDTHTTTQTHTQPRRHVSFHLSACMCACVDSCKNAKEPYN